MSFGWNRKIKIEKLDASKRRMISQVTPKEVVNGPFGFRQEDIINSLCIVVSELVMESEEKAKSLGNIQELLGEIKNGNEEKSVEKESDEKKSSESEGERNNYSEDIIYNSQPS